MKNRLNLFRHSAHTNLSSIIVAGSIAVLIGGQSAQAAATYYWDNNTAGTAGFGSGGGTWGTSALWGTNSAGSGALANTTITTADDVNFGTASAGLGAGTVTGPATAQGFLNMNFGSASGAILLSGGTLNLAATSTITVNNVSDTVSSVLQGSSSNLTKAGVGTLLLSGTSIYTGATNVNAGTLQLSGTAGKITGTSGLTVNSGGTFIDGDTATAANNNGLSNRINSGTTLTLNGGSFQLAAAAAANTHTQSFNTLSYGAGSSTISTNAATGTNTLTFSAASGSNYTRAIGGLVNINTLAGFNVAFTNAVTGAANVSGAGADAILFGATLNNTDFIAAAAGNVSAATYTTTGTTTWTAAKNMDVTGTNGSAYAAANVNSVRFNTTGSNTVTLASGTNTIAGGILVTNNVGSASSLITGGTITGAAGSELLVNQNNTGGGLEIASTIADNTSTVLTKGGAGTLVLSGLNSYTGGTFVNAGVLTYLNTGAKPSTGTTTVAAGATLGLGVATSGSFFTSANIDSLFAGTLSGVTNGAGSNVGIDTTQGSFNYATSVAGSPARGLVKLGNNTLTLSGASTYTGATAVNAGTLKLNNGSAINATSGLTVASGATFDVNGNSSTVRILSGGGSITNTAASGTATVAVTGGTWTGAITDGVNAKVALTINNTSLVTLGGTNTFTGGLTIGNSSNTPLTVSSGAALGNGLITVALNSSLRLTDTQTITGKTVTIQGTGGGPSGGNGNGALNLISGTATWAGNVQLGSGTTTGRVGVTGAGNLIISGAISNTAGTSGAGLDFVMNSDATLGTGKVTLSAAAGVNTYTGNTTIGRGVLVVGANDTIPTTSIVQVGTGGTIGGWFDLNGFNQTIGGLFKSGSSTAAVVRNGAVTPSTLTLNVATGASVSYVGNTGGTAPTIIDGSGVLNILKSGLGTQVFGSTNTYTGSTTVNAGKLTLDFSQALAPATNIINNSTNSSALILGGGTLELVGKASTTNSQRFNGLTLNSGASAVTLTANATANPLALNVGAISRNAGSTVDFIQPTGASSATNGAITSTSNTNGILGGYATVAGTDWATNNGTNIVALASGSYTNDTWSAGNNTTVTLATNSAYTNVSTNSLRFNTLAANTVTLAGVNTITSGGILVTSTVGNNLSQITGGTLQTGSINELVVIQNNSSNSLEIASTIIDNGSSSSLTKSGAGRLLLSSANTYTGETLINNGKVALGNALALQNSVYNTTGSTGAIGLDVTGFTTPTLGGLKGNVNLAIAITGYSSVTGLTLNPQTGSNTYSGVIADGAAGMTLTKTGAGTQVLSGANTFSGSTVISNGKIVLGNALALQNSAYDTTGSTGAIGLDVTGFATPTLGGLKGGVNLATAITGYGSVTGLTLNPQTGQNNTYSGIIADGATGMTLTKTGAGTQILSGQNSYTGLTTVSAGTLSLGNATDTLSNSGAVTVSGGTLDIGTNSDTVGIITLTSGSITGSTGVLTGSAYNVQTGSISAKLAGNAGLTKSTSGTVTLTGALNTTNNAGSVIRVSGGTSVSNSILTLSPTSTSVAGALSSNNSVNIGDGLNDFAVLNQTGGTVNSTSISIGNLGTGTYNLSGGIANTNNVTMAFTGPYSGTGESFLNISGSSALNILSNGVLKLGTFYGRTSTIIQTGGDVSFYSNAGTTLGGTGGLAFNGGAGSYTLSGGTLSVPKITLLASGGGAGGGTGTINLDGGTLKITNNAFVVPTGVTFNVKGSGVVANSGANIDTNGLDISFNAALAHSGPNAIDGGLNKLGTGTLALSEASSYTGDTNIATGTLLVNNTTGSGTGTGSVSVAAGATNATAVRLGGTGTISGATSFAADPDGASAQVGGIHSPGDSSVNGGIGKQTFTAATNSLTYNTGSIFEWQLGSTPLDNTSTDGSGTGVRGTDYDAVNATALAATTGAIFRVVLNGSQDFTSTFWDTNREWSNIFQTSDAGSALSISSIFSGGFQYYNGGGGTLVSLSNPNTEGYFTVTGSSLTWSAVPEPTSALAGLLITAGLLRRRRNCAASR